MLTRYVLSGIKNDYCELEIQAAQKVTCNLQARSDGVLDGQGENVM